MPREFIDNHLVISYSDRPAAVYWKDISTYILKKYGPDGTTDHETVERILLDLFQYIADKFKSLIHEEKSFTFFLYVFNLHEESIKINNKKTFEGLSLHPVDRSEFAMYRRILKNVLEQGCEVDMVWGSPPTSREVYKMDDKMQDLIYLGRWMYDIADSIALHKMVPNFHSITFRSKHELVVDFQFHYAELYHELFPKLQANYEKATFDDQSVNKLIEAIKNCFRIDYGFARQQIFEIKVHHSESGFQTIQIDILAQNLSSQFGISIEEARLFYHGLILSRETKMSLEDLVYKPYNMKRYMFRPILVYKIAGEDRALVGPEKFTESIFVMSTNAIHWNALPSEWLQNLCMQRFVSRMADEHDKILENAIEDKIRANNLIFVRNIKSFKQLQGDNVNINSAIAGEIDFIIVNERLKHIFVADSKYNRARYEAVGFRNDYSQFVDKYEPKIEKKANWVHNNLSVVAEHFQIIFNRPYLDLIGFQVQPVFFINTPTFYMLNGKYKAISLNQVSDYLTGRLRFANYTYKNTDQNSDNQYDVIGHPYFTRQ